MKKALKITGIIVGVFVIAAIVIIVFFPGLPTYIKVKKDYPHIDETIGVYNDGDVVIPKDFVQTEINGILVSGPSDALCTDGYFIPFKKENELMVMVTESESASTSYTDESCGFLLYDYRHFFQSLDVEMPETTYEGMKFIRNLTAKDCLKLRGTDRDVFEEYAQYKEFVAKIETVYNYERDDLSGFVCDLASVGKKYEHRKNLMLVDGEKEWIISVLGNDEETVAQIIASVQLAE